MSHSTVPPSPTDPASGLAGLRVLVVEDHAIGRILLDAMLSGLGISAKLVATGAEAEDAMRATEFDVVLIDLGLPDVHGEHLARALARLAHGRRSLFVAVTGRERPTVLPAVFAEWLEKPFSVRDLHRLLGSLAAGVARSA